MGDPGDAMFLLLEGALDVVVGDKVVEHSTRGATVVARQPSRLARVDQRRFLHLIQLNPFFATPVTRVLAGRLRQMNQWLGQKPGA
jgi:CRP-like cAMP-binding protein